MRMKKLGNTGLVVSELCLGAMTFGGGEGIWAAIGKLDQAAADDLVKTALDRGVNFFDTANVYSAGASEVMLGRAFRNLSLARDQFVVATKVLGRVGPGVNQAGLSRYHIFHALDASLKRLQLDHIDLYQIHGQDLLTPLEETLEALDDCVRAPSGALPSRENLPESSPPASGLQGRIARRWSVASGTISRSRSRPASE